MRIYREPERPGKDITGRQFGRLKVSHRLGTFNKMHYWLCVCECGRSVEVPASQLLSGNNRACGCLGSEITTRRNTTHGQSKTPLYGLWHRMIQRCEDQNCGDYIYYGARGITVCESWHDFEKFKEDVGDRPKGFTIDRIDNSLGYGPNNFRWASRTEQANNMRSNVKTLVDGKLLSIKEMADKAGIAYGTMKARLCRLGYTPEQALGKPVKCGQTLERVHAELTETQ